ncbi:N-acetyltransferase [Rhodococcus sp. CH91]|uniref:N-acetyltransferase n=1 Tax=Rhodococcus sp. CH91 TaxID=2910256 RepID=UPI001F4B2F3C|nr:N-acetyltransferase [Rhodococcus sp. CH91]
MEIVSEKRAFASPGDIRRAYGASMRALTSAGGYDEGEGWWVGITGAPDPDYNLALVHDGDVAAHAEHVYEVLTDAGHPSIILLAGHGLGAAQVLADHGWVCAGSLDLTCLDAHDAPVDPRFRTLGGAEMAQARELASGAFGIVPGTAAVAYADAVARTPGAAVVGIVDDGQLQCCTLLLDSGPIRTVWSLGTRAGRQRRGYANSLIRAGAAHTYAQRGPVTMCGLTRPRVTPLYLAAGARVAETWQMWSRPRWLLGS